MKKKLPSPEHPKAKPVQGEFPLLKMDTLPQSQQAAETPPKTPTQMQLHPANADPMMATVGGYVSDFKTGVENEKEALEEGTVRCGESMVFNTPDKWRYKLNPGEEIAIGSQTKELTQIKHDLSVSSVHCFVHRASDGMYWFTDAASDYGSFFRIPPQGKFTGATIGTMLIFGYSRLELLEISETLSTWSFRSKDSQQTAMIMKFPNNKPILVGRAEGCDLRPDHDDCMSIKHASITYNNETESFTVQDGYEKPSLNGSWVRIGAATMAFNCNTTIKIGNNSYLFFC